MTVATIATTPGGGRQRRGRPAESSASTSSHRCASPPRDWPSRLRLSWRPSRSATANPAAATGARSCVRANSHLGGSGFERSSVVKYGRSSVTNVRSRPRRSGSARTARPNAPCEAGACSQPEPLQRDAEVEPGEPVLRANADGAPERVGRLLQVGPAARVRRRGRSTPGRATGLPGRRPDRRPRHAPGCPRPLQRQPEGLEEDRAQPVGPQRPPGRLDGTGCVSEPDLDQRLVVVEHLRPPPAAPARTSSRSPLALAGRRVLLDRRGVPVLPQVRVAHLQAGAVREVGGPAGVVRHVAPRGVHARRDLVAFGQHRERLGVPARQLERRAPLEQGGRLVRRPGAALLARQTRRLREQLRRPLVVACRGRRSRPPGRRRSSSWACSLVHSSAAARARSRSPAKRHRFCRAACR